MPWVILGAVVLLIGAGIDFLGRHPPLALAFWGFVALLFLVWIYRWIKPRLDESERISNLKREQRQREKAEKQAKRDRELAVEKEDARRKAALRSVAVNAHGVTNIATQLVDELRRAPNS